MSDINSQATVNLTVNGQQPMQVLQQLKQRAMDLENALGKAAAAGDRIELRKIRKELSETRRQIRDFESSTQQAERVLRNLDKATPKELSKTLQTLKRQLDNIERGSSAWNAQVTKIKQVKAELQKVNDEMKESQSWLQRMNGKINEYGMMAAGVAAAASGIVMAGRGAVNTYAEIEQEMASVRKFTGMTDDEVKALNEEFKKMDTRTSREELNQLAQEAGRLGLSSQEDVLGFVRAADKINIALDDLGDGATLTLSKLTEIFGDRDRLGVEKSLLAVGSVINELSQNCAASAPFIAEFASRMGGVGAQMGMTTQEIMGFGAVLDSYNMQLESSATAIGQVLVRMYREPAKYAKIAGLDVKDFSETLKSDANAALIMFLEALNKAGGMVNLSPMFKDMGENGARVISVLSALAQHVDDVKLRQQEANKAFEEATSIDKEAAIQQETVAAKLEKAKKAFTELVAELGEKLVPVMRYAVTGTKALMTVMSTIVNFVINHKRAVVALAAAITGYTIVVKGAAIATAFHNGIMVIANGLTKAWAVMTAMATAASHLWAAAMAYLSGNMVVAKAEMAAFNAVCAANPIGAIVVAIMAAVTALGLFNDETDRATGAQDALSQAQENGIKTREKENLILEQNIKKLESFNGSKSEEARLVKELNNKYGPILGTYKTLADWLSVLKKRGRDYVDTVYQQILIEGKLEQARQLIAEAAKARENKVTDPGFWETFNKWSKGVTYIFTESGAYSWSEAKELAKGDINYAWDQYADSLEKQAENLIKEAERDAAKYHITLPGTIGDATSAVVETTSAPTYTSQGKTTKGDKTTRHETDPDQKRRSEINKIKQKKEFKEDLDEIEQELKNAAGINAKDFYLENISYEEMLDANYKATLKFYEDKAALYKKYGIEDDVDGMNKMRDEQLKDTKKYNDAKLKVKLEGLKEERDAEIRAMEERFITPDDELFQNQDALNKAKFKAEEDYLEKVLEAYKENDRKNGEVSQNYRNAERNLEKAQEDWKLRHRQEMHKKLQDWLSVYDKQSAQARMDAELAILEEAREAELITQEMYLEAWQAIVDKYRREVDQETGTTTKEGRRQDAKSEFYRQLMALETYHNDGLISEKDYQERRLKLIENYDEKIGSLIKEDGEQWSGLLWDAFSAFSEAFKEWPSSFEGILESIEKMAKATFAIMNAGLEIYSSYAKASSDLEIARIEAEYKKREKGVKDTTKLEAEKEKKIKAIKTKANEKAMKIEIAQAIASTALGAINAYASAAKAPWPLGMILAPIAAGLAVAAGAIQIATIKKQHQAEALGYAKGGFTKKGAVDEPAGIVHAGEWVASQKLLDSPVARPLINALDYAQRTNTIGSLKQEDVSRAITAPAALAQQNVPAIVLNENSALKETIAKLNERLNEPFVTVNTVTGDLGIKKAQDDYQRLMNNKAPKNKRS